MAIQIRRTATPDNPPSDLESGQLAVEMASDPPRLWCGVPFDIDPLGRRLLGGGEPGEPLLWPIGAQLTPMPNWPYSHHMMGVRCPGWLKHNGEFLRGAIVPSYVSGSNPWINYRSPAVPIQNSLQANTTYYVFLF